MLIFVYGTLRQGQVNHHYLEGLSTYLGLGYIKADLYQIVGHHYPAVIKGDKWVAGEVYDFDPEGLEAMDHLEGYISENNENNFYNRLQVMVYDEDYQEIGLGETYFMNTTHPLFDKTDLQPLPSQDFLKK